MNLSGLWSSAKTYALKICAGTIVLLIIAGMLEYVQIVRLKANVSGLERDVELAMDANKTSAETIRKLDVERKRTMAVCQDRLSGYDATIAELQRIDALKGGNDNEDTRNGSADDLLLALNRLFAPSGDENGVRGVPTGTGPAQSNAVSGTILYCLESDGDAKNLIKNITLLQADRDDCKLSIK
jgi:hypothetical protein